MERSFLVGAIVAAVGSIARTALRETPEFVDAKSKYKKMLEELNYYKKIKNNILLIKTFDRLHNMQTISFKAIGKQKKIAIETLKSILPITMHLNIPKVERLLSDICFQALNNPKLQAAYSYAELKKKVQRIM